MNDTTAQAGPDEGTPKNRHERRANDACRDGKEGGIITESIAGRPVYIETVETEPVRVKIFADGRMDRQNAAKYIDRKPKTLAMWATNGKGPPVHKISGRCYYLRPELDAFLAG